MFEVNSEQIAALQQKIADLSNQLEQAKLVVKQWSDASAQLSRNAAEVRAKNQGLGRGLGGALLGSKFRSAMRSVAASSNAAIANGVDPVKWTMVCLAERSTKCQEVTHHIHRNFAGRW